MFKLIKEKVKLLNKTKEQRLDLLLSGENTLLDVSHFLKKEIISTFLRTTPITMLFFCIILLTHQWAISWDGTSIDIVLSTPYFYLLVFFTPFVLILNKTAKTQNEYALTRNLFKNVSISYLTKNAKQINNYLSSTEFPSFIFHGFLFQEHICDDEYYEFLYADIENSYLLFNNFKYNDVLIFDKFYKLRNLTIEKNDISSLNKLDSIYNDKFLNNDLDRYIKHGRSDFDADIFDYLNIHGCRADLYNYFKTKNSTVKPDNLKNAKVVINQSTIEINILNRKEEVYANF